MNKQLFDEMEQMGWRSCVCNFVYKKWESDYFLLKNGNCLLIVDTAPEKAHITADIIGPQMLRGLICKNGLRFKLYYGYANTNTCGRIRGVYHWTLKTHIPTLCI
jgi:hypothetical protein